jgi:hypothetical protein
VSGVFPIDPHHPAPERGPNELGRLPATVRDAPPGFKAAAGTTVEGRLLGRDAQGHLMLRTKHGVLTVAARLSPPTGSLVLLQFRTVGGAIQGYILGVRPPDEHRARPSMGGEPGRTAQGGHGHGHAPPPPGGAVTEGANALTRAWPALEEAASVLQENRSSAVDTLLARLPRPGPDMASGLMFLLAALQRGDVRTWLGQTVLDRLSRAGRDDLVQRLEQDFGRLVRFTEDSNDHWRLYALPLLAEGRVQALRIFVHAPDPTETRADAHRVVVETQLPHLGDIQLDTLIRRRRMDMILRSREPLPETLADHIRAIQAQARDWGRMGGEITFTAGSGWRFLDLPVSAEAPHGMVV